MTVGPVAAHADAMLDLIGSPYVQLHTGDPGDDGTSNVSAETTREQITFSASSGGVKNSSSQPSWQNWAAGTETITHVSLWTAASGGTCEWTVDVGDKAVNDDDDLTLTSLQLTATPIAAD